MPRMNAAPSHSSAEDIVTEVLQGRAQVSLNEYKTWASQSQLIVEFLLLLSQVGVHTSCRCALALNVGPNPDSSVRFFFVLLKLFFTQNLDIFFKFPPAALGF